MFEKLYKTVDSQIQPSLDLINETKSKMKEELNNSNKVVNMNFYKYGTIAACLIIFIGALTVNTSKNIFVDEESSINETVQDSYRGTTSGNISGNPFNTALDSVSTSDSVSELVSARSSFFDVIVEFFESIIQWFKELLF